MTYTREQISAMSDADFRKACMQLGATDMTRIAEAREQRRLDALATKYGLQPLRTEAQRVAEARAQRQRELSTGVN